MSLTIAPADRPDLDHLIDWAAAEGWNPGLDDAAAFHGADPGGFLLGWIDGEPAAAISAVRHAPDFGFLGLYICRPPFRGRGHGWSLWCAGMDRLGDRTVGLDGVVAQQPAYQRSGFVAAHRNIRFRGRLDDGGRAVPTIAAAAAHIPALLALDRAVTGVARPAYLTAWFAETATRRTLVTVDDGAITGVGTVRRCRDGCKVGPLIAGDGETALGLLAALSATEPGRAVFLDVPEPRTGFIDLLTAAGFVPVFETARMYKGPVPPGDPARLFGQTTLELG